MTELQSEITRMVVAVVQSPDSDLVETALQEASICFIKLPSSGGFLLEKNVTFLIACNHKSEMKTKELLTAAARKRISYVAAVMDNTPFPMIIPAETMVGGVTYFSMDVEHFEEY